MRILQISDFHLDDITSIDHLRLRNYREYLKELANLIVSKVGKIDYVVATGDFIHKNKTTNFEHAKTILTHLTKHLELDCDSVCVCIGNHDFDQNLDAIGKSHDAREEYYKFRDHFSRRNIIKSNDFAILYKIKDIWCLSLDSTWGSGITNKPRSLTTTEIDEIISDFISDNVPENDILIILSHYPMVHFQRALMYIEEKNWEEQHEWKDAHFVVERVLKLRRKQHTIYFFGDGHIPDFTSYDQYNHFIMTAMFGSRVGSKPNQIDCEAKVFEITADTPPKIYTFKYELKGYDQKILGDWRFSESTIRLDNHYEISIEKKQKETDFVNEQKVSKTPIIISTSIQDAIIEKIANEGLYSLDRYATSHSKVSLGWIYTNRLLCDSNILSQIANRTYKWFSESIMKSVNKEKFAFIGIDYWGAVIASQVSIRSNIRSYCIASKAGASHYTYKETVNYIRYKKNEFSETDTIVLFTDVIATGDTIFRKKEKIEELLERKINNWYVVSVIADKEQNRDANLDCFLEIVTFCSDLRTPVLLIDQIPSEKIVPTRLDLRVSN